MNYYFKALRNYSTFTGRATRSEYWYFFLFNMIASFIYAFIIVILGIEELPLVENLYSLAVLIPGLAVGVRRMHDVGKSGWYLFIPIYNLFLAIRKADTRVNQYGINPNLNDF